MFFPFVMNYLECLKWLNLNTGPLPQTIGGISFLSKGSDPFMATISKGSNCGRHRQGRATSEMEMQDVMIERLSCICLELAPTTNGMDYGISGTKALCVSRGLLLKRNKWG
jgi:hypothetical protein